MRDWQGRRVPWEWPPWSTRSRMRRECRRSFHPLTSTGVRQESVGGVTYYLDFRLLCRCGKRQHRDDRIMTSLSEWYRH